MNGLIDLLNQNQGVLAIVALGITIVGGLIVWLFKKEKEYSVHADVLTVEGSKHKDNQ